MFNSRPKALRMLTASFAMILSHTMAEANERGTSSIFTHQCGGFLGLSTLNRKSDSTAPECMEKLIVLKNNVHVAIPMSSIHTL